MKLSIIALIGVAFSAEAGDKTALVEDLGRAPASIFKPFEKTGSPELFKKSEAPALLEKDMEDVTSEKIPLHIEQFVDF